MAKQVKLLKTAVCIAHQREYPIEKFYLKLMEDEFLPTYAIPYCEDCCEEMVRYYLERTGSIESAMWFTCAKLDIPFIRQVFEAMMDEKDKYQKKYNKTTDKNFKFFKYYYKYLWGDGTSLQKAGVRWECFLDTDVALNEITTDTNTQRQVREKIEQLKLDWGEQDSIDDYKFLVYNYKKYTKGLDVNTPQQEDLYRDLCLARLEKRKVEEHQIDGDLTKIQTRILTLMKKLNIDNFVDDKPKSLSEQLIFQKIAMIEEHEPADFYKDPKRWEDTTRRRKYYKDMVLRPTLNAIAGTRDFDIDLNKIDTYLLDEDGN